MANVGERFTLGEGHTLRDWTIESAGAAFRSAELSPVALTEMTLAAIEELNPQLNAYLTVLAESARAEARAAEAAFKRGEDRGPLQGIPIALKDLYDVAGVRTTAGSIILADNIAAADSAVTERLRAGGAVLLGKLHLHEWATGVTSINPHFGPCRNPWDPARIPGGSSGGSAAALAAGLCLGSYGSDTGGSIRIPAALCGVVGLKPTRGRVSLRGVVPLSWSLDHAGPLARSVRDAAILLQAVAGYDPDDPGSIDWPVDNYVKADAHAPGLAGLHVLVPDNYFFETGDPVVLGLASEAVRVLERLGARVEHLRLPGIEELSAFSTTMNLSDAATYHAEHLRSRPDDIGADVLARYRIGQAKSATDYSEARQQQRIWRRRLERSLEGATVLATPSTPLAALPIQNSEALEAARRLTSFTAPFNLTGLPAISVPCGFTTDGLPAGLQLVGRPWAEALVLQVAEAYERATEWRSARPRLAR
jgi:aspartyl-tRNA(Asn)/glutamyl-tRNA(Gln) amidotransferase subunit A